MSSLFLSEQPVKPVFFFGAIIIFSLLMIGGSGTPWVGISLFALWAIFILAGHAVLPQLETDNQSNLNLTGEQSTWIIINTTVGICLSLLVWMGSAYLWHSLWPGTGILVIIAAVGAFRLVYKQVTPIPWPPTRLIFIVTSLAFSWGFTIIFSSNSNGKIVCFFLENSVEIYFSIPIWQP